MPASRIPSNKTSTRRLSRACCPIRSLVIVKSGQATFYLGSDPTCTAHVVPAGSGFVDSGGDVHVVRNEGAVDLVTVVASLVPEDAVRRIDEPDPGNCPF